MNYCLVEISEKRELDRGIDLQTIYACGANDIREAKDCLGYEPEGNCPECRFFNRFAHCLSGKANADALRGMRERIRESKEFGHASR